MEKEMIIPKTWNEFRGHGLLLFINQILHIFGWAIVLDYEKDEESPTVYPARIRFRGFNNEYVSKCYKDLSKFLLDNAADLYEEACE